MLARISVEQCALPAAGNDPSPCSLWPPLRGEGAFSEPMSHFDHVGRVQATEKTSKKRLKREGCVMHQAAHFGRPLLGLTTNNQSCKPRDCWGEPAKCVSVSHAEAEPWQRCQCRVATASWPWPASLCSRSSACQLLVSGRPTKRDPETKEQ